MLVLIAIANPFIYVLLSAKWLPSVPYFQMLCLASLFTPFYVLNLSALNSRGHSRITFRIEFIKKGLILLSVLSCFSFGIIGLLLGYVLSCFLSYLISTYYIKKDILISIKYQILDLLPNIVIGSILAILAFSLSLFIVQPLLLLSSQLVLVALIYVIIIKVTQPKLFGQVSGIVGDKVKSFINTKKDSHE